MKYIVGAAFGVLAALGSVKAADFSYTFTDLGSLGGNFTTPYAINASGEVVGTTTNSSGNPFAFLYKDGVMTSLGAISPIQSTLAMDINDSGLVVNGNSPTFEYNNGVSTPLSFPYEVQALRVNNLGLMVVTSDAASASTYDGTTFTPIGSLGGSLTWAYDISDDGSIVGSSTTSLNKSHAFLYKEGAFTDLGTLVGGSSSSANSINASGTVVGKYVTSDWAHAFMYSEGVVISLESSPVTFSEAFAVNNFGVAVGVFGATENDRDGFVYKNGILLNLNDLVSLPAGYTIQDAVGINDAGQILAYFDTGTGQRAALLNPVAIPEPGPLALALVGLVVVVWCRNWHPLSGR